MLSAASTGSLLPAGRDLASPAALAPLPPCCCVLNPSPGAGWELYCGSEAPIQRSPPTRELNRRRRVPAQSPGSLRQGLCGSSVPALPLFSSHATLTGAASSLQRWFPVGHRLPLAFLAASPSSDLSLPARSVPCCHPARPSSAFPEPFPSQGRDEMGFSAAADVTATSGWVCLGEQGPSACGAERVAGGKAGAAALPT